MAAKKRLNLQEAEDEQAASSDSLQNAVILEINSNIWICHPIICEFMWTKERRSSANYQIDTSKKIIYKLEILIEENADKRQKDTYLSKLAEFVSNCTNLWRLTRIWTSMLERRPLPGSPKN